MTSKKDSYFVKSILAGVLSGTFLVGGYSAAAVLSAEKPQPKVVATVQDKKFDKAVNEAVDEFVMEAPEDQTQDLTEIEPMKEGGLLEEPAPAPAPAADPVESVVSNPAEAASLQTFTELSSPAPAPAAAEPEMVIEEMTPIAEMAPAAPASPEVPAAPISAPVQQSAEQVAPETDGIWHVTYVNSRGASSAPADGSIGLWADGWFIAHSYTPNGNKIASFPPKVEVDGKIYHLADKWVAGDLITTDEVARVRANDGITFQTCITETTNWMVHYEPDGAGYGYQFAQFPYTVNDNASIGYYPSTPVQAPVETPIQTREQAVNPVYVEPAVEVQMEDVNTESIQIAEPEYIEGFESFEVI